VKRYAVAGAASGELLSYGGLVLVHGDRAELEFLLADQRVVEVPAHVPDGQTMPWARHPQMDAIRFPLNRADFR
jgi:hypothetical protein